MRFLSSVNPESTGDERRRSCKMEFVSQGVCFGCVSTGFRTTPPRNMGRKKNWNPFLLSCGLVVRILWSRCPREPRWSGGSLGTSREVCTSIGMRFSASTNSSSIRNVLYYPAIPVEMSQEDLHQVLALSFHTTRL